jgi:hypothetical protein
MRQKRITHPMTKSPVALARRALAVAQQALPAYSCKFSPRRFTQAQLFACLVLMQFFKTDYRGICQLLQDWRQLRHLLGLSRIPHYSTLCYAHQRLMRQSNFRALLHATWQQAVPEGETIPHRSGIVDATGLEARHVSRHFVWRAGYRRFPRRRWPKLTLVGDAQTHLIGAAVITWGPSQDSPQFPAAIRQSAQHVQWDRIIADTAYDAEHNHRLCRQQLGIRSTVIPLNPRRGRRWPKTLYRRQMKRRFFRRVYHQRWQVESLISRHKRRLGSALHSRIWRTQKQECLLRVLTHNLMLLV